MKTRIMRCTAALLALLLLCCGCDGGSLEVPTDTPVLSTSVAEQDSSVIPAYDDAYFAEFSPASYILYLDEVFSTLLPLRQRDADMGLGQYFERFAATDLSEPMDQIQYGLPNYQNCSQLPVFYGLLRETARYLEETGNSCDARAEEYGYTHALAGADVTAMAALLLRKPVPVQLASVAGAEYLPEADLFVYNELENPYQDFLDAGWTLEFVGSNAEFSAGGWNEEASVLAPGIGIWYDAETGAFYDFYGTPMGTTNDLQSLLSEQEGTNTLNRCGFLPLNQDRYCYRVQAYYQMDGAPITRKTPIAWVMCGSAQLAFSGTEFGDTQPKPPRMPEEQVTWFNETFFDDYYRDPAAGEKVTNYLLLSFYEQPEDIDLALVPERFSQQTLDAVLAAAHGERTCTLAEDYIPYVVIQFGEVSDDHVVLYYYNEYQKTNAAATLAIAQDGYTFVSNLPVS